MENISGVSESLSRAQSVALATGCEEILTMFYFQSSSQFSCFLSSPIRCHSKGNKGSSTQRVQLGCHYRDSRHGHLSFEVTKVHM